MKKPKRIASLSVVTLASVLALSGAVYACSGHVSASGNRPGWGHGDKNHHHTGPPGQSNHPGHGHGHHGDDQGGDGDSDSDD